VFETEDCYHLIEATVSRSMSKAQEDIKKSVSHARKLQQNSYQKATKCWFITKHEPTADQREVADKHKGLVSAMSFEQFQAKLVDAASYLNLRENYPFGSVRDPVTGDSKATIDYVPLSLAQLGSPSIWTTTELVDSLPQGKRFVLLGDYGAGKSTTLRETFRELRRRYFRQRTPKFPIYLNLRDHFGQNSAAEILERHARNIGFAQPTHLVRAWRAGFIVLLVDGFDEVTTLGIQGFWKRLQDVRFRAMEGVRQLVRGQPHETGMVLAGRAHFFDSAQERKTALATNAHTIELTLSEFTTEQVQTYLSKSGLKGQVPWWLPSKPLLVGYLAASGLLKEVVVTDSNSESFGPDPVLGWDFILDRICQREAEIEAGIDGATVRRILERLSSVAALSEHGLGALRREQVIAAFTDICGYEPDERALVLLQRLPGLGIDRQEEGTRAFLDDSLADACRAGDVVAFVEDPYGTNLQVFQGAQVGLGALGVSLAARRAAGRGVSCGKFTAAIERTAGQRDLMFLVLNIARVMLEADCAIENPMRFEGIFIPTIELFEGMRDCSRLHFHDCYFTKVELDPDVDPRHAPRFFACYVGELDGRSSAGDLPAGVFDKDCEIEGFVDAPTTTDAIAGMDLPIGGRVLLSVLKKLYMQSGSGRKESALHRGLDHRARRAVAPVLRLLQREGLISPYRRSGVDTTIWVPDRAQLARVARIVASPHTCNDGLLTAASELT